MNSLLKTVAVAVLGGLFGQVAGCAPSSLVNIWHDPSFQAPPLDKMLVVAVRKDATKRRLWEDAFAGELAQHGVAAAPSYSLFPDAPPDTSQLVATVQEQGFDGVLVILRLPNETDTHYVQGYTSVETERFYSPYWQRYVAYEHEVEQPGYIDSQTIAIRGIEVTTTGNGGRLVWGATSRTPDPGSMTDIRSGIASLVIADLAKRGIIGPRK